MERWGHNARLFASRGGLKCLVIRVPSAPSMVATPHYFRPMLADHFVRDPLLVPFKGDKKNFDRFVQFGPFSA